MTTLEVYYGLGTKNHSGKEEMPGNKYVRL